jgi:putative membrane protein
MRKALLSATFVLAAAVASVAVTSAQSPASKTQTPPKEKSTSAAFLKSAAEGGQQEVTLATTAESKASNSQVKSLAETIRKDHESANAELKTLAEKKNVTLPMTPSTADKATHGRLEKLSGAAFDKAYVAEMVKDHRADITEFQKHEKDSDPDVAAWATKTLPHLQNHLKMALDAQKALGGTSK